MIPSPFTLWKHYKGGIYQALSICTHSETLEDMVYYQTYEYGKEIKNWVRPLRMWGELVETPNGKVPRFVPLTQENCDHLYEGDFEDSFFCQYCDKAKEEE